MNSNYVVGLMSGTSLDGIDSALVKINDSTETGIGLELVHYSQSAFSQDIKQQILKLCDPKQATLESISQMNFLLGEQFAEAANQVISESSIDKKDVLLISSHGQTIFHQPEPVYIANQPITSTLQIGDISVIAERTGVATVGDFRPRDMAAGGQGAPLVPFADFFLFKSDQVGRVLVNIGGIANMTVLPKGCGESDVLAYDTGPGNMIIDAFVSWATDGAQTYDKDGKLASEGKVHQDWLATLLSHPYYSLLPPKSTGRELFGFEYAQELWKEAESQGISHSDKIATITELTAMTIANEIKALDQQMDEVLVSGGGAWNKTLMGRLGYHLGSKVQVGKTDSYGIPVDAKESMVFALLGYLCFHKRVNNLPTATGARHQVVMGKIAW